MDALTESASEQGGLVDDVLLRRHAEAITEGDNGWQVTSALASLPTRCQLARVRDLAVAPGIASHANATTNRVTDLRTIAAKLDWMRQLRDDGELDPMLFMHFASSDVGAFLTNVRSCFDHLCALVAAASRQPGATPSGSFSNLRTWIDKRNPDDAAEKLGPRAYELITSCEWFVEMRELRDNLVHRDALTLVFPAEPGIEFQVYKRYRKLINDDRLAVRESTVRFEWFAAAVMSRLWELTEDISAEIADRHGLEPQGVTYCSHWGLGVLKGWTDDLRRGG